MSPATLDALHAALSSTTGVAACTLLGIAGPLLGFLVALGSVGGRPRAGRAALTVGRAVGASLGLMVLLRVFGALAWGIDQGPLDWLAAFGSPSGGWRPADVVAPLAGLHGLVVASAAVALGRAARGRGSIRGPVAFPGVVAAILAVALLALLLAGRSIVLGPTEVVGLDLLAAMPTLLVSLAVASFGRDEGPVEETSTEPEPDALPFPDVVDAWRRGGALGSGDGAWCTLRGSEGDPAGDVVDHAWRLAGGSGPAPGALASVSSTRGIAVDAAMLVGDLPAPTQEVLLRAALLLSTVEHGQRALVIVDDPDEARARLVAVARPLGLPGEDLFVAGAAAFVEALSAGRRPAALFVGTDDLANVLLPALGDATRPAGRAWLATASLIVLPRIDRGAPLLSTHRAYVLRRLDLQLRAAGARFGVLATGFGSRRTLELVRRCFSVADEKLVPLQPRSHAGVSVWLADFSFLRTVDRPWPARAASSVVEAGYRVRVADPVAAFGREDLVEAGADVMFERDVTFEGVASVGVLDDLWLVAAWRALPNRLPVTGDPPHHHALWGLLDTPTSRFLLEPGRLDALAAEGRLEPPAPVVGFDNRRVAVDHLRAAVAEAPQDLALLEERFGTEVTDVVRSELVASRRVVLRGRDGRAVVTKRVSAARAGHAAILGTAVEEARVQLIDRGTGARLGFVDACTAATRFHPHRVFAWGARRYTVPLQGEGGPQGRLKVEVASPARRLSLPNLVATIRPTVTVERIQRVTRGSTRLAHGLFDARVTEVVSGTWQDGEQRIMFPPVTSTYDTRVRLVWPEGEGGPAVWRHLAHLLHHVLRSHLAVAPDDLHVEPVAPDLVSDTGVGLAIIDRQVGGVGIGAAIDADMLVEALVRVGVLLSRCACTQGCRNCTPAFALAEGGVDRKGVIRLLGGAGGKGR